MAKNKSKTGQKTTPVSTQRTATAAAVPETTRRPLPDWAILGLLFIPLIVIRWQMLDIPLERDESVYYYLGKTALEGGRPYFDFYEMKPPGLFYSYAFLIVIFGYSGIGAHLALLFVSLSNTFFTYLIAKRLAGKSAAIIAAFAFIFLSFNPGASGIYLDAEHVALLWGLPGVWLALESPGKLRIWQLLLSGILLSLSVLVKQTAAVFGIAIAMYWLVQWLQNRREQPLKPVLWWILGGLIPLLGAFLVVWASGTMAEAQFWLSEYPQRYVSVVDESKAGLYFKTSWNLVSQGYLGYFWVSAFGFLVLWLSRIPLASKVFLTLWAVLSVLTVLPGMRFYGHYWLLSFPAICIGGAMLFSTLSERLFSKSAMPVAVLILGLVWGAHHLLIAPRLYSNPPLQMVSRTYSPGNPFVEHQILSEELEKVLQPNDTVAVFGSDPQYFIYLNKKSPIRHVYMPFIAKGQYPQSLEWQTETLEKLKSTRPKYVIFNAYPYAWMARYDAQNPFIREILTFVQPPDYDPYIFIEADSKSKPAVVKLKVQEGAVKNNVNFIQVYKRRD